MSGPPSPGRRRREPKPGAAAYPGILAAMRRRLRDLGYAVGRFETGPRNSLVDVPGVRVGHATLAEFYTGVTCVLPHADNPCAEKVLAPCHVMKATARPPGSANSRSS